MIAPHAENIILAVCAAVVALSMTALWMLARPNSWLSRRVDEAVALPEIRR